MRRDNFSQQQSHYIDPYQHQQKNPEKMLLSSKFKQQQLNEICNKLPKQFASAISSITQLVSSSSLSSSEKNNVLQSIQIIIKKATQPQVLSFKFEKGFNQNPYPIFGIIAWNNEAFGYPLIDWKLCSYVEGGGVRCLPIIEIDVEDYQKTRKYIKQWIQNIHGLIIPEYSSKKSQKFFDILIQSLNTYDKEFSALSFGCSSKYILRKQNEGLEIFQKQISGLIDGRLLGLSQSKLFSDIQSTLQVKILAENLTYSCKNLSIFKSEDLQRYKQKIKIQSYLILNKSTVGFQLAPFCLSHGNNTTQFFHFFIQIWDQYCPLTTSYLNKIMINFVNQTKKCLKNVKAPAKYVANFPLEYKNSELKSISHYKILSNTKK